MPLLPHHVTNSSQVYLSLVELPCSERLGMSVALQSQVATRLATLTHAGVQAGQRPAPVLHAIHRNLALTSASASRQTLINSGICFSL